MLIVFPFVLLLWFGPFWTWLTPALTRVKLLIAKRSRSAAVELLGQMTQLEGSERLAHMGQVDKLVEYKFFTSLVVQLLDYARKFGANISAPLRELARGLNLDHARERELKGLTNATYIQFAIVTMVTWAFIVMSALLANIKSEFWVLVLIVLLELSGALLFSALNRPLRKYYFGDLDFFIKVQYSFKALTGTSLCAQVMMKRAGLDQLLEREYKRELSLLQRRLKLLITRWQQTGSSIESDWNDALEEAWSLHQLFYARYLKALEALKFILLTLFFLSSYFIFIGSLFASFFGF